MFRSDRPVVLQFPPFRGLVRSIVLAAAALWLVFVVLSLVSPGLGAELRSWTALEPSGVLHGQLWRPFTYSFVPTDLIGEAFNLFALWIFAAQLEEDRGRRWLWEFFLTATAGGGLLACVLSTLLTAVWPRMAGYDLLFGMGPAALAVVVAFGYYNAETQVSFNFFFRMKAKHLAMGYVVVYTGALLLGGDRLGALNAVCVTLAAVVYLRLAPRRGFGSSASEGWFGLRNVYYLRKRRRAAKKFTVYMKKQGKEVSIDEAGRYVDPSGKPRDPNDRKWMN